MTKIFLRISISFSSKEIYKLFMPLILMHEHIYTDNIVLPMHGLDAIIFKSPPLNPCNTPFNSVMPDSIV
jgi:hypothetical protein